jgi:hypothetical protein
MTFLTTCRITRAVTVVLGATSVLLLARPAAAQSLSLAPAEIIADVTPGQPVHVEFTVSNSSNAPVAIRSTVTDLWYNEKNEKTFEPAGSSPRSAANWIQFVPRLVTIEPHSSTKVTAFITPPPGIEGGYYAVVFVESKPELMNQPTADAQPVLANIRLGALVLLTATGTERDDLELTNIRLTPPAAAQPLQLKLTAGNKGNTHVFPKATLAILDADRRVIAKAQSEPKRFLPGQTDDIAITWGGTLPPGSYEGVVTVVYGNKQVRTQTVPFTVAQ